MTNDIKNSSSGSYVAKVMLLCFSLLVALPLFTSVLLMSADAFASGTGNFVITAAGDSANETALSRVMCNVLSIVTGTAGKTYGKVIAKSGLDTTTISSQCLFQTSNGLRNSSDTDKQNNEWKLDR